MVDEFDEPAVNEFSGVRINPRDVVGHLLLVWVIEYLPHKPTQFSRPDKPSDVIVVDVVDLDLPDPDTNQPGLLARHVWWRQAKLIQALRDRIGGKPMLAYMAKGGASAGFNAPFVLNSATKEPAAVRRAQEWMARNPTFAPSAAFQGDEGAAEPAPAQVQSTPTLLERMTNQSLAGAARLPQPPQGPIPF
jgi:hypothetical protein